MTIIADLIEPVVIEAGDLSFFQPFPIGGLVTVGWDGAQSGVVGVPVANRFPTPASAIAFLTDEPDEELQPVAGTSPYFINGALSPESDYLEPTLGQIWPRIG